MKNRKMRKTLILAVVAASLLLAILIGVVIYMNFSDAQKNGNDGDESTGADQFQSTDENGNPIETEDLIFSTPFGELAVPGQWKDRIRAETTSDETGGSVAFYGTVGDREELLFTLRFGRGTEGSIKVGSISVNGTNMDVHFEFSDVVPDDNWTEKDADDFCAMQESVNYMLEKLKENPGFTGNTGIGVTGPSEPAGTEQPTAPEATAGSGSQTEPEDFTEPEDATSPVESGDVKISTPFCDLYLPSQWKESIRAEGESAEYGYIITFFGSANGREVKLFTVFFAEGSENSYPVGILTVDNVSLDVNVEIADFDPDDTWTTVDIDTISAMQESVNYMIQKLSEHPGFEPV